MSQHPERSSTKLGRTQSPPSDQRKKNKTERLANFFPRWDYRHYSTFSWPSLQTAGGFRSVNLMLLVVLCWHSIIIKFLKWKWWNYEHWAGSPRVTRPTDEKLIWLLWNIIKANCQSVSFCFKSQLVGRHSRFLSHTTGRFSPREIW